ncbi:MAG: molybdenum cofactor synthesis domain-containing protein [Pseudomonadota bacterium]
MPIDHTQIFQPLRICVLTISDSRTRNDDKSGRVLQDFLQADGHHLADYQIIRDDKEKIIAALQVAIADDAIDIIITTGGTGVTGRDVTPEALDAVAEKHILGFGELFRMLSFAIIDTSCVQSRACAVVAGGTYIFALPGSPGACRDGWEKILRTQLDIRHRPCASQPPSTTSNR